MRTLPIAPSLIAAILAVAGEGEAEPPIATPADRAATVGPRAGAGLWIVSPRGYWRHHYTFRPAQAISKEGKLSLMRTRYAAKNARRVANRLTTGAAPPGWADPDFDDSGWCVGRAPLPWLPGMDQDGEGPYSCHVIRKVAGRTRFIVPDPAKVTRLTLDLHYRGGVIAYVNGREVGRGHIPTGGPLAEHSFAEPYPEEAYRPVGSEQAKRAGDARLLDGYGFWTAGRVWHPWRVKPEALDLLGRINAVRVRRLRIDVPGRLLRPGVNVLAIENRVSPALLFDAGRGRSTTAPFVHKIPHIGIDEVALQAAPTGGAVAAASADIRPAGVQAWVEDIHRWLLAEDFLEPGVRQRRQVRMAVARNGTCSGQVVVGTSRELPNPRAGVGELVGPGGAKLAPSAVRVRWGRSLPVGLIRKVEMATRHPSFRVYMQDRYLIRYRGAPIHTWVIQWSGTGADQKLLRRLWAKEQDGMRIFDQLGAAPPASIPAGASQPIWVTVQVPRSAAPGAYTGTLAVQADGLEPITFHVRLHVFDFALPEPKDFTAYAGIDESPWSLAAWHKVKLWSPEHWKLVEQSVRYAGKLGARVAGVPIIHKTELDNGADAMIKWVRKPDGAYGFDFSVADRYLDLWRKYCHSRPDVIVYLVHPADGYGRGGGTGAVTLVDAATGKETAFTPPKPDTPEGLKLWLDCARASRAHFNRRGIGDANLHWGLFYDYIGQAGYALAGPLGKEIPTVGWARSSHEGRGIHGGHKLTVTWNAAVRAEQRPPFARDGKVAAHKGWKNPKGRLLLPRADSDVNALSVYPPLWQLREVLEMPITSTYRGFARICVDGWGRGSYFGPYNSYLTYPAADGSGQEAGAQFEVLREGIQEAEARVFLERQDLLPAEIQKVLDRRTERIWMIPPRPEGQRIAEYFTGWQEMSWDLYAAAAAPAGGTSPSQAERQQFFASAPR